MIPSRSIRRGLGFLFTASCSVAPWAASSALAQEPAYEPAPRPAFQFLRQREDWSKEPYFAPDDHDGLDPLKYVRLSDDGKNWATFAGQTWLRTEGWNNFNFGTRPPNGKVDDIYASWRLRLSGDFHFGDTFRVFIEGKSALVTERDLAGGKRPIDEDLIALQQLFADVRFKLDDRSSLTLRPGRQMLLYGKQRLVSPLPWGNTLRTWDGVSALYKRDAWSIDGFATRFVPVQQTKINTPDSGNEFYGVYASKAPKGTAPALDGYWLGLHNDVASFNGTSGSENRQTLGGRIGGTFAEQAFDYDFETAVQFGTIGNDDIMAGMVATQVGRRFANANMKPRAWIGFDYASGDGEPGDGDAGTFNQLYPLGHAYFGYIDTIGRQNILDASFGASCKPSDKVTLEIGNHAFWVPSREDAVYNAGGGVVRPGGVSSSNYVGFEVDLTATYVIAPHLDFLLGYSHFFAGSLIDQSGASEDIDFVYFTIQYTF